MRGVGLGAGRHHDAVPRGEDGGFPGFPREAAHAQGGPRLVALATAVARTVGCRGKVRVKVRRVVYSPNGRSVFGGGEGGAKNVIHVVASLLEDMIKLTPNREYFVSPPLTE